VPRATNLSGSSRAIDRQKRIVVLVEHETHNISTVVRLTFSPVALRWVKRLIVAQLALDTAAMVGWFTWTSGRGLL
jgi:hypothetical protein